MNFSGVIMKRETLMKRFRWSKAEAYWPPMLAFIGGMCWAYVSFGLSDITMAKSIIVGVLGVILFVCSMGLGIDNHKKRQERLDEAFREIRRLEDEIKGEHSNET